MFLYFGHWSFPMYTGRTLQQNSRVKKISPSTLCHTQILINDFSSHYNNIANISLWFTTLLLCTILLTVTKMYSPATSTEFNKQPVVNINYFVPLLSGERLHKWTKWSLRKGLITLQILLTNSYRKCQQISQEHWYIADESIHGCIWHISRY